MTRELVRTYMQFERAKEMLNTRRVVSVASDDLTCMIELEDGTALEFGMVHSGRRARFAVWLLDVTPKGRE